MASDFTFEISGLEELERDLTKAVKQCPEEAKETLKVLGREFRKTAYKNANRALNKHVRKEGDKKGAIKRKWDSKVVGDSVGMAALIWNSARHFHLVENGHKLVRNGTTVGFVPGKHIMEKTREEYKEVVPERFERMIDDILKGCNL